ASKAALATLRNAPKNELREALLDHENQRFRFSYVLGRRRPKAPSGSSALQPRDELERDAFADLDEFDTQAEALSQADDTARAFDAEPDGLVGIDLAATEAVIDSALATLRSLV